MDSAVSDPVERGEVLKALGELALAASQAEARASQGLYYLLTDLPGSENGAARIAAEFRSFDSIYRLLRIASYGEASLNEMLSAARTEATKRDRVGGETLSAVLAKVASTIGHADYVAEYVAARPRATATEYLTTVKALYDKRNECLHALDVEVAGKEAVLRKHPRGGKQNAVNANNLLEPCIVVRWYDRMTLAQAIEGVALELAMASAALPLLPVTVQWFRRQETGVDLAKLADHYLALAMEPLDTDISLLKTLEAELQAKLDAYRKGKSVPDEPNRG